MCRRTSPQKRACCSEHADAVELPDRAQYAGDHQHVGENAVAGGGEEVENRRCAARSRA